MSKCLYLPCIFILFFGFSTIGVSSVDRGEDSLSLQQWKFGGQLHYGFLINHSNNIVPINEQNAFGAEMTFSRQTHGENAWNKFFNYPEYGLSYMAMSPGSPNYVGTTHYLFPFVKFHLFDNHKSFNMDMRLGAGLAYAEKVYDARYNPLNLAIGTHLNFTLNLQFYQTYKIQNNYIVFIGEGLSHISNGAIQMPNAGLNIVTFFAGMSYSFGNKHQVMNKDAGGYSRKTWQPALYITGGIKKISPSGGKNYFAGGGSFELSKRHLDFTRFAGIADITYDTSDYDYLADGANPPSNRFKTVKIGLGAGYEFIFNRLSLVIQVGVYLYAKNKSLGIIYQRNGLRYAITKNTSIQLALRNQRGNADFVELGLGTNF